MPEDRPSRAGREIGKAPERCPNCGAILKDVPYPGPECPHCGYDLESNPMEYPPGAFKASR